MGKAALIAPDIAIGEKVLEALDRADLKVSVAMWAILPEYEDWRYVLAARLLDTEDPRDGYGLVHKALAAANIPAGKAPPLFIMSMTDRFIRALRRHYVKYKIAEGTRIGGHMIGDRFVEDAFAYRIR